jgi:hypothetical protein
MLSWGLLSVWIAGTVGCQESDSGGPAEFGVQVRFLTGDGVTAEIPAELYDGYVSLCVAEQNADCGTAALHSMTWSVGNPTSGNGFFAPGADIDGDGRPEQTVDSPRIPEGVPLKVVLTASATLPGPTLYSARADGVVLQNGKRRFIQMTFFPVGRFASINAAVAPRPATWTGRFGARVTPLADGRVLITGGFDAAGPARMTGTCADVAPGAPAGSICFTLLASKQAFLFLPNSGEILEVYGTMNVPNGRAFHTVTPLPDGRALVAGGADFAVAVFSPTGTAGQWTLGIVPFVTTGAEGFVPSFEIFDPNQNSLLPEDPYRDGNPERGGFGSTLGVLQVPRFLAAAALAPPLAAGGASQEVVLFGGRDPDAPTTRPATTWEIFNIASGTTRLATFPLDPPRTAAGVHFLSHPSQGPQLWVVGGALGGQFDTALVAKWYSNAMSPDGITEPGVSFGADIGGAGKNFLFPTVVPIGNRVAPNTLLVAGSYGPSCRDDGAGTLVPEWPGPAPDPALVPCPPAAVPPYSISLATGSPNFAAVNGWNNPAPDHPHMLGAAAGLGDGTAIMVGGAADLSFSTPAGPGPAHRIVNDTASVRKDGAFTALYPANALLPSAATTPGGDALFVGGFRVDLAATPPAIQLLDDVVLFNID